MMAFGERDLKGSWGYGEQTRRGLLDRRAECAILWAGLSYISIFPQHLARRLAHVPESTVRCKVHHKTFLEASASGSESGKKETFSKACF